MKTKLFASAIFALGAIVSSTTALAASSNNSVVTNANQDGNAVTVAGGAAVRGNDLIISTSGTEIAAKSEIVVRLPKGLNFEGAPTYMVTTGGGGLTLVDEFGGPTLDQPAVTWSDTDLDGGMDRAVVVVKGASTANNTLTISVNVTAGSDVAKGVKKASISVGNDVLDTQPVVEVLAALAEPVQVAATLVTASQEAKADVGTLTSTFIVTIPKGTAGSKTITIKPQTGLKFASSGSAITWKVHTPVASDPIKEVSLNPNSDTASVNITIACAAAVCASADALKDDVQIAVTVSAMNTLDSKTTGKRGLDLSGVVTGSVDLLEVKANGSSAAITKTTPAQTIPKLVVGRTSGQDLPSFTLTENFDGDLAVAGGSDTITITPNAGLTFDVSAKSPTLSGMVGSVTANATAMTITITANPANSSTITISNLRGKATKTASGDLSIKVGTPGKNGNYKYTVNGVDLVLATAVAQGTVEVTGPKLLSKTGPSGNTVTNTVTLKETTYGAVNLDGKTDVQSSYISVTPSANATITAVALSYKNYAAGATPTIGACTKATGTTDGSYICVVTGESTAVTAGTSTISVAVDIAAKKTAEIGSTLDVTLGGNAGVSGSASLASVSVATTTTAGAVPDIKPGSTSAASLASVTIKENYTGAITVGKSFRLLAPAGVAFQNAAAVQASTTVGTATITATFNPNDTLVIQPSSSSISFTAKVVVASDVAGMQEFKLVDGDVNGTTGSGVGLTEETLVLAYADGTLKALDAGSALSLAVGFSDHNAVSGGLADYTVKSSDSAIATAEIVGSNVVVKGVAAGAATITVTDHLGATDSFVATVVAGAAQPEAAKVVGGADDVSFSGGASSDNGVTFGTEFTTSDVVTVVVTANIAEEDQGKAGAVHVAVQSKTADGNTITYLDEDGVFQTWDLKGLPGAAIVTESFGASHDVTVYSGTMAAGTHRIAVAYTTEDGKLIYAPKAVVITVTE
jgi:hypothetical protein